MQSLTFFYGGQPTTSRHIHSGGTKTKSRFVVAENNTTRGMVLGELGAKINQALADAVAGPLLDDGAVDNMLKQVCNALMAADVQVRLVVKMRQRMQERLKKEFMVAGVSKRKALRQVSFCSSDVSTR
jgi:hypothetical protein